MARKTEKIQKENSEDEKYKIKDKREKKKGK